MTIAERIDSIAGEGVLVFGSPPPAGRDLDLLVRPPAERAVAAELAAEGFVRRGHEWVRFAASTATAVELVPAEVWGLAGAELDDLFACARPIEGFSRLLAPSPEHLLLIVATRMLARGQVLTAGRRQRVERAVATEPAAWERARRRERRWGQAGALDVLREALEQEQGPDPVRAVRLGLWRLRRRRVVALSGIDGSGKSTQARALAATLERLGHPSVVVWTPLASDAWLARLAGPVKRLLGLVPALGSGTAGEPEPRGVVPNPGSRLRERSGAVNAGWSTLVAVANALAHARLVAGHASAGRVVIFDRYVLDSLVRLRFLYGEAQSFRLQRALVRRLSPKPLAAFFLDVEEETSLARKDDRWTRAELAAQVLLYREEHEAAGVARLDGARPPDELAAEVAEAVWRRLG